MNVSKLLIFCVIIITGIMTHFSYTMHNNEKTLTQRIKEEDLNNDTIVALIKQDGFKTEESLKDNKTLEVYHYKEPIKFFGINSLIKKVYSVPVKGDQQYKTFYDISPFIWAMLVGFAIYQISTSEFAIYQISNFCKNPQESLTPHYSPMPLFF